VTRRDGRTSSWLEVADRRRRIVLFSGEL